MNNIIIFGPPGAGKGTMCKLLKEEFGYEHLSTGDVIREHQERGTETGKLADKIINSGNLLPDEIVIRMVKEKIIESENKVGILFDGFPRTATQARILDEFLWKKREPIEKVINIEIPFDVTVKRILSRAEKENRPDDNAAAIKVRIKAYKDSTFPLLEYFRGRGKVIDVDGSGSVEDEYKVIKKALED